MKLNSNWQRLFDIQHKRIKLDTFHIDKEKKKPFIDPTKYLKVEEL